MLGSEINVVRGVVKALYCTKPGFSAGEVQTSDGCIVKFAGNAFVKKHDPVVFHGKWANHSKYGRQFAVARMEFDLPVDPQGLAAYLSNSPEFRGIGRKKAKLIADGIGPDFDRVITFEPEVIADTANISLDAAQSIRTTWIERQESNAAMTGLAACGFSYGQSAALIEKFGDQAVPMIKNDPYLLVGSVPGLGFGRVDKIALQMGRPKDDPKRIRAGVLHSVDQVLSDGHSCVEYDSLIERAGRVLAMDRYDSREKIERQLGDAIRVGELTATEFDSLLVTTPRMRRSEEGLARTLLQYAHVPNSHFPCANDVELLIDRLAPQLNSGQREAALRCLTKRISLLCGSAGAGKTFTVRAIVNAYKEKGYGVVLAAPTGKAAERMGQIAGHPAGTIHRMLGFNGKTFSRGSDRPIEADLLVIDEVSMLDSELAWHLFQSIDFSRTVLLLVGDPNQLPPIGAGSFLRDLVKSRVIPTTVLTEVVRQAGELKRNSLAILDGKVLETSNIETEGRRVWYRRDEFGEASSISKFLVHLFQEALTERLGFDPIRDVQVLSPTHKGPLGTEALNAEIQRVVQKKLFGIDLPIAEKYQHPKILLHDRVIQTRNNYDLGVMNGTVGYVREVTSDGSLLIDFDGSATVLPAGSSALRDLQLAYCLSVHKCQGSEFPCVINIIHRSHAFMHHRHLLYTGVTRAQKTSIILGDSWAIRNCANRVELDSRHTLLSHLLAVAKPALFEAGGLR